MTSQFERGIFPPEQDYKAAYGFFTADDRLKMGEYLGEGKMWPEEMRQNTGVAKWMRALETGVRPE